MLSNMVLGYELMINKVVYNITISLLRVYKFEGFYKAEKILYDGKLYLYTILLNISEYIDTHCHKIFSYKDKDVILFLYKFAH